MPPSTRIIISYNFKVITIVIAYIEVHNFDQAIGLSQERQVPTLILFNIIIRIPFVHVYLDVLAFKQFVCTFGLQNECK